VCVCVCMCVQATDPKNHRQAFFGGLAGRLLNLDDQLKAVRKRSSNLVLPSAGCPRRCSRSYDGCCALVSLVILLIQIQPSVREEDMFNYHEENNLTTRD
jgi:hypothetical protein